MTYQAQLDRAQLEAAQAPREREISTTQWKSFAGAFGGWMLDGFDLSIFGLVLLPAMTELLPRSGYDINTATIGFFGQLQVAIFLAGWGCSFIWGPIADRLGRVPALTFSILVYAVFTCLAGFSQDIWQLSAFRFLSAVGLGGEWAMAGTLVAETMPERLRPRFGGILHAGCYFGILCGSIINYAVGINLGWRVMFYIGILPALFVLYIRSQTVEPARWVDVSEKTKRTSFSEFLKKILRPPLSARTWINVLLLFVALMGFWAGSQYLGASILTLSAQQGIAKPTALQLATLGLGLLSLFTIIGCLAVPWFADRYGRRNTLVATFILMIIGIAGGFGWAYYQNSMLLFFLFIPILGLGGADFAMFTIWLPEQFPTEVRATAFAFCTTMSRFAAALGTFLIGYAIASAHTIGWPLALTAVPFLLGIWLAYLAPETRGQVLPE
jgi:MFS family permease